MGISINLTDPENPRQVQHEAIASWDFKEDVITELQQLGVPLRPSELVTIDFKVVLNTCHRGKLTPKQTANILFENVMDPYKNDNGSWKFTA